MRSINWWSRRTSSSRCSRARTTERDQAAASSVCINTEQDGTPFFDLAMRYATLGPVAFDISPFSLAAIRRTGLPAARLPLGYVASMDRWHGSTDARSIDIGFLAGRTPRREAFIGGAGGQLWEWRTDLRFFSWHRPARADHPTFTHGSVKYQTLADTRILLNVHRGDDPYFEWARVVEAVANGCVIATETSLDIAPFVAGEHLLMAPLDDLAEQAVALAFDEPRRARMAAGRARPVGGRARSGSAGRTITRRGPPADRREHAAARRSADVVAIALGDRPSAPPTSHHRRR